MVRPGRGESASLHGRTPARRRRARAHRLLKQRALVARLLRWRRRRSHHHAAALLLAGSSQAGRLGQGSQLKGEHSRCAGLSCRRAGSQALGAAAGRCGRSDNYTAAGVDGLVVGAASDTSSPAAFPQPHEAARGSPALDRAPLPCLLPVICVHCMAFVPWGTSVQEGG